MTARVPTGHDNWCLCAGVDCSNRENVAYRDASWLFRWLQRAQSDPSLMAKLRGLLLAAGRSPGAGAGAAVVEGINNALSAGRLHVCREDRNRSGTGGGNSESAAAAGAGGAGQGPAAAAASGPKTKKTWVEFKVVDMEGNPAAGRKYLVMLPDGSLEQGQLDANGMVRFDRIDPENSVFSLPDLDQEAWEPYER